MKDNTKPYICKKIKHFVVLLILLIGASNVAAYGNQNDPDQMFLQARDLAAQNNYEQARTICNQILDDFPDYHDAIILKARTYAWENNYPQARDLLKDVLQKSPRYNDALYALIDVEIWSENYTDAIRYLDIALANHPNSTHLLYRKALALKKTDDEIAAVVLLNRILDMDPTYTEAKDLLDSIKTRRLKNHIGLGYRGHYFTDHEDIDPWHLFYAELGRRSSLIGPLTGRVNIANRYELTGFQIEFDAYPSIRPGTYLYLNAGYSPDDLLFPVTRFGFEIFQSLPASFEASIGFRLLNFANSDLLILTGSFSKYYRKYYFSFRPYYSFSSDANIANAQSYFLTIRRFFSSSEHYLSLMVGRGLSDDYDKIIGGQVYDLGGTLAEAMLLYQQKISTSFLFKIGAGYKMYNQDINDTPWGDPVIVEGGIIFRF